MFKNQCACAWSSYVGSKHADWFGEETDKLVQLSEVNMFKT